MKRLDSELGNALADFHEGFEDVNEEDLIIDEQPIKLKLNLGAVGAVPGSRAGAVGAVPGSRTGGGPGGRPSPAGGPKSPSKKPLKVTMTLHFVQRKIGRGRESKKEWLQIHILAMARW